MEPGQDLVRGDRADPHRRRGERHRRPTRTIDHHLRNIFHRLGVRSRTELARLFA
ncbi:LuxR C-terminal-related transcriptional regulator [Micromonospora fulviviridis]|uniref:LuxR C-terminal-related transcriptional regulator n=1 Tax=Micromonospora fulviviridis TaxID=47860 RepID=UPI00379E26E6